MVYNKVLIVYVCLRQLPLYGKLHAKKRRGRVTKGSYAIYLPFSAASV
jgi:hypothetical protein